MCWSGVKEFGGGTKAFSERVVSSRARAFGNLKIMQGVRHYGWFVIKDGRRDTKNTIFLSWQTILRISQGAAGGTCHHHQRKGPLSMPCVFLFFSSFFSSFFLFGKKRKKTTWSSCCQHVIIFWMPTIFFLYVFFCNSYIRSNQKPNVSTIF